ncbi:MAG: hypothetical protein DKM23_00365 [Candidatus Melainabacteria bacterium]|nr:MAG: hypothetical protein DKM23_00365 [Candidatus Melainabacteria bacterium]
MNYLYKNYYGSGFIKNNPIPNDLDVAVGVDLGEFEYDGENPYKTSRAIVDKISTYHLYSHIVFLKSKKLFLMDKPAILKLNELERKKVSSMENIADGIEKAFNNDIQIVHSTKDYKGQNVNYTLVFKPNEIFVDDITPVFTYTSEISYNKTMSDFPRELTVVPDFYAKIKNTKTGEIKSVDLVEESFLGERFQISRRFFVPLIFTGNQSLKYLKSLDFLTNDEKYLDTRMFNYFRYVTEVQMYLDASVDPVKLLKRLHQCTDIISPALTQEQRDKIYSDIDETLSKPDIQTATDYLTIYKNIKFMTQNKFIMTKAEEFGYFKQWIVASNACLELLSKNSEYKDEVNDLLKIHNEILAQFRDMNSEIKLAELNKYLDNKDLNVYVACAKIINKNINNTDKFVVDFKILNDVFKKSGYHSMDLYWINKDTVYIARNEFTKTLTQKDILPLIKENGLPQVNYKLLNETKLLGNKKETVYVRYKSTEAENKYLQELEDKLLQDKKNFKIKRKYLF